MLDYYDKIVGGIAASLLGGVLVGVLTSVTFHVGLFFGAIVATVFVLDALFRNPPLPSERPLVTTLAILWFGLLTTLGSLTYLL